MKTLNNYITEKLKIRKNYDDPFHKILELLKQHKIKEISTQNGLLETVYVSEDILADKIVFNIKNDTFIVTYIHDDSQVSGEIVSDETEYSEWYNIFDEYVSESIYKTLKKKLS